MDEGKKAALILVTLTGLVFLVNTILSLRVSFVDLILGCPFPFLSLGGRTAISPFVAANLIVTLLIVVTLIFGLRLAGIGTARSRRSTPRRHAVIIFVLSLVANTIFSVNLFAATSSGGGIAIGCPQPFLSLSYFGGSLFDPLLLAVDVLAAVILAGGVLFLLSRLR